MDDRGGHWVTRYSSRGHPVKLWKFAVPRINDRLLQCVVYLYPSRPMADAGESYGGSGFLIGLPVKGFEENCNVLFVVTNRHVAIKGNTTVRLNITDGKTDIIETDDRGWLFHPRGDDLAICPIFGLSFDKHEFAYILPDMFINQAIIDNFKIGPGDDCFVTGRFINHEDKQRNAPSVRFGCIAQMPGETIKFPDGSEQESFLVEIRSISGYSGSPVFVQILPMMGSAGNVGRVSTNRPIGPWLLGIDHCHLFSREKIFTKIKEEPINDDWYVRNNTGMMGVVPCWKLSEMLDLPDIRSLMDRAVAEAESLYRSPTGGGAEPD